MNTATVEKQVEVVRFGQHIGGSRYDKATSKIKNINSELADEYLELQSKLDEKLDSYNGLYPVYVQAFKKYMPKVTPTYSDTRVRYHINVLKELLEDDSFLVDNDDFVEFQKENSPHLFKLPRLRTTTQLRHLAYIWKRYEDFVDKYSEWLTPTKKTQEKVSFTRNQEIIQTNEYYTVYDDIESTILVTFGIKGVEFGKYIPKEDMQTWLISTCNSLQLLSELLNVDKSAIGNKTLSIGYGARGCGSHAAHYEPSKKAINLTKSSGVGCLMHEYAHYIDRENNDMPSRKLSSLMQGKLCNYYRTLADNVKSKYYYYSSNAEIFARFFEWYISDKLEEQGIVDTFLVNLCEGADFLYPNTDELKEVVRAFFNNMIHERIW